MKKISVLVKQVFMTTLLLGITVSANAQEFIASEDDTTVMTEYNDGQLWAYRQIGDFVVGMSNHIEKDDYGDNYQIMICIKNLSENSSLFDPSLVTSTLINKKDETEELKVYTYEQYMKKVKNSQAFTSALTRISNGLNVMTAGRETTRSTKHNGKESRTEVHTTYNSGAASAACIAASTNIMTQSKMMADDRKTISQGYLKKTTIHPDEGIMGYMNIKHQKGLTMTVNIPIEGQVFSFDWDIAKK